MRSPTPGRVLVNGKPAKASYTVKIGDIIEVTFGNRPVKIRVLSDVGAEGQGRCAGDV